MKQKIKNKLLADAAIDIIKKAVIAVLLFSAGISIGYTLANKECEPCTVGFASLEDMTFLVTELRQCKGFSRYDL
jgi:hypothetical protein